MQLLSAISFKILCKRLLSSDYPQRDAPQVVQMRQPS